MGPFVGDCVAAERTERLDDLQETPLFGHTHTRRFMPRAFSYIRMRPEMGFWYTSDKSSPLARGPKVQVYP